MLIHVMPAELESVGREIMAILDRYRGRHRSAVSVEILPSAHPMRPPEK